MTVEERVAGLPVGRVCEVLARVVRAVEANGAHPDIRAALVDGSLLVAERPQPIPVAEKPQPVVAPMSDLARILAVDLPTERGRIRREDRKTRSARIRQLFKDLGLKRVSVTTPSYSMASSTHIQVPAAVEHDRSWNGDHDYQTCPHCQERAKAVDRIGEIIVTAFPDMEDRSDFQSDYHDNPLSIH